MAPKKRRSKKSEIVHEPQPQIPSPNAVGLNEVGLVEEPYAEFAQWLDGRLKALEARFSHMITPRSRQLVNRPRMSGSLRPR